MQSQLKRMAPCSCRSRRSSVDIVAEYYSWEPWSQSRPVAPFSQIDVPHTNTWRTVAQRGNRAIIPQSHRGSVYTGYGHRIHRDARVLGARASHVSMPDTVHFAGTGPSRTRFRRSMKPIAAGSNLSENQSKEKEHRGAKSCLSFAGPNNSNSNGRRKGRQTTVLKLVNACLPANREAARVQKHSHWSNRRSHQHKGAPRH
ncbi:hypothetical protein EXIGLDRAFT_234454 [Exidia glandulosa HHB12029]|uniref:Uncharacterized protein n=1 Tax=Exidia glandulosa HHB12029 TaxID=1314781 RepID=A0A165MKA4_EXIGL|nr:hypothetical protein EXIGLDRAFT_234454 [Exidia glandulosa HHB12029]